MAKTSRLDKPSVLVLGDSPADVRSVTEGMVARGYRPTQILCSHVTGDWYEWWHRAPEQTKAAPRPSVLAEWI